MQQAVLIIAHNNLRHIADMVRFFGAGFAFYVHLDRRQVYDWAQVADLQRLDGVRLVTDKHKVYWGGISITYVQLLLAAEALKDADNQYFHLISGQDIPLKGRESFFSFFEANRHLNFMETVELPATCFARGGLNRMTQYHLHDFCDLRSAAGQRFSSIFRFAQQLTGISRSIPANIRLYGGSGWWSLRRATLQHLTDYTKSNPNLIRRFRYCFASDEHYVPTVIMNTAHAGNTCGKNLRYIDWKSRHGSQPAILDETDAGRLFSSDAFFARKISFPLSASLVQQVWKHLKKPEVDG